MRMGQGVRTGLGHGGITCVLQKQFSSFSTILTFKQQIAANLNLWKNTEVLLAAQLI